MITEYQMTDPDRAAVDVLVTDIVTNFKSLDGLLRDVRLYSAELPRDMRVAMHRFGTEELSHAIVIRQTGLDDKAIPPTPSVMPTEPEKQVRQFDVLHLLLASTLGEIFTFDSIQLGTLVSDVFPVRANADRPISSGYSTEFAFHTDDAFTDYAGAFLGLRCLRNPGNIPTSISYLNTGDLAPEDVTLLRSTAYDIRPNLAHSVVTDIPQRAVLFGAEDDPYIRLNLNVSAVDHSSAEQRRAYEHLVLALQRNKQNILLNEGDCLYIDNYRAVHAREPYEPRFDGSDRWYRRVYISADIRLSRAARRAATSRVILMETA